MKMAEVIQTGRKCWGKRRKCSSWAISPSSTAFSKDLYYRHVKTRGTFGFRCFLQLSTQNTLKARKMIWNIFNHLNYGEHLTFRRFMVRIIRAIIRGAFTCLSVKERMLYFLSRYVTYWCQKIVNPFLLPRPPNKHFQSLHKSHTIIIIVVI